MILGVLPMSVSNSKISITGSVISPISASATVGLRSGKPSAAISTRAVITVTSLFLIICYPLFRGSSYL
ncbi:hypothetical protein ES703_65296 [subsurface metagenome]